MVKTKKLTKSKDMKDDDKPIEKFVVNQKL